MTMTSGDSAEEGFAEDQEVQDAAGDAAVAGDAEGDAIAEPFLPQREAYK